MRDVVAATREILTEAFRVREITDATFRWALIPGLSGIAL